MEKYPAQPASFGLFIFPLLFSIFTCGSQALKCYYCVAYGSEGLDSCIQFDDIDHAPLENANFCYKQTLDVEEASANNKTIRVIARGEAEFQEDDDKTFLGFTQDTFCRVEVEENLLSNWNTNFSQIANVNVCYCKTDWCNL